MIDQYFELRFQKLPVGQVQDHASANPGAAMESFFGKVVSPLFSTNYQFVKRRLKPGETALDLGLISVRRNIDRFPNYNVYFGKRSRYLHAVPAFEAEKIATLDNERHHRVSGLFCK